MCLSVTYRKVCVGNGSGSSVSIMIRLLAGRPGFISRQVRPGRETHHSSPSSADVKNIWRYTSTPSIRLHGLVLN
jgi:hypothetical protein